MLNQKVALAIFVLAAFLISPMMQAFAFSNGQAATIVLGQNTFTTRTPTTTATGLDWPMGIAFDSSGNLWVAESHNSRVLMYPKANLGTTGSSATIVLGQNTFTTNTADITTTGLDWPMGIAFDSSGNLWVVDTYNSRVLMYPKANLGTSGSSATIILGLNTFTTITPATTATGLYDPDGIAFDSSGNLWVTDNLNNRVLMYPKANLGTSGSSATIVLGQNTFTTRTADITATGLHDPDGIAFDSSGNLWVADSLNNRVLMYSDGDTDPTTSNFVNGEAATIVLGQNTFTTNHNNGGASSLLQPLGIAFDSSGNLWVADSHNSRVLMYPKANLGTTGSSATIVLGQNTFTTITPATTATGLNGPAYSAFDPSGNLWVADELNNRVLMYHSDLKTHFDIKCKNIGPDQLPPCRYIQKDGKISIEILREVAFCYYNKDIGQGIAQGTCPPVMTSELQSEIQHKASPLKQFKAGWKVGDIVATKGEVLITNDHRTFPASVTQKTAESLMSRDASWHYYHS